MKKFNNILKWMILAAVMVSLSLAIVGCGSESETSSSESTEASTESASAEVSEAEGENDTAVSCEELYEVAASKAEEGLNQMVEKENCTLIVNKYWDMLDDFFYATDDEQVYCICIVRTLDKEDAETVEGLFNDQLESMKNDTYLTTDQQEVVQAARVGSSGEYVWYISLSSSLAENQDAENALKEML